MHKLGEKKEAKKLLNELHAYATQLQKSPARIDYFATSLPTMLLFEEDLQAKQHQTAKQMKAIARQGF